MLVFILLDFSLALPSKTDCAMAEEDTVILQIQRVQKIMADLRQRLEASDDDNVKAYLEELKQALDNLKYAHQNT